MRRRGFTLIELTVVVCVVAVLFGIALERLFRYQELGERAVLQQNLAAMNTALSMKFAAFITDGRPQAVEGELGKNPQHLLTRPPENYLGELDAPDIDKLPRPSWHFDRRSADLVYLPLRDRHLSTASGRADALRFRVYLTQPRNAPGDPKELRQPFVGAAVPFTWEID